MVNLQEGSSAQVNSSGVTKTQDPTSLNNVSRAAVSVGPRVRRNSKCQPLASQNLATAMSRWVAHANNKGKWSLRGPEPCHQSSQKSVPLSELVKLTLGLDLWVDYGQCIFFNNLLNFSTFLLNGGYKWFFRIFHHDLRSNLHYLKRRNMFLILPTSQYVKLFVVLMASPTHSVDCFSSISSPPVLFRPLPHNRFYMVFFILPRNTDLFSRLSLPSLSPLSHHRCRCHPTPVASAADWRLHDAARLLLLPCLLPRHRRLAIPGANPCRLDSLRSQTHYIRITMARAEPGPGQQGPWPGRSESFGPGHLDILPNSLLLPR
jgi:hypothetical protein